MDLYLAVVILILFAALFTIAGGLTAVIWTDFIQVVIMVIGSLILMVVSFVKVGGYEQMVRKYKEAWPNTTVATINNPNNYTSCGYPPENYMNLIRSPEDGSLPWPGIMFGLTISSVWYWCSDQVIVQRALAAKNLSYAKAGTILAGYLKFLPLWIMVIPGMIARILFTDKIACSDPDECMDICGSENGCTNLAYPTLVMELMPNGLRGLMLAVMMSALISSLTSIFNSSSTIFTMDIWRRIRKQASDIELMIVGRACVVILVVVAVVWIPIVQHVSELFHYIQAITSFLAPPICAVYVLAVFWKRTNEQGAFWGLMIGLVTGLIRFGWEYAYTVPPCGQEDKDERPDIIKKVHYLHFGILLWGVSTIATIIISLLTKPIDDKHLHRLTFWNRFSEEPREDLDKKTGQSKADTAQPPKFLQFNDWEDIPWYKKAIQWICGVEKMQDEKELTEEEKMAIEKKQNSIHETKLASRLLNVNAIVLMVVATFLWGFFA